MFAISVAAQMTLGLVGVFFIFFPLLVNVILGFIAAQVLGERQENLEYERAHTY
jgi:hypothetical protein